MACDTPRTPKAQGTNDDINVRSLAVLLSTQRQYAEQLDGKIIAAYRLFLVDTVVM